VAPAIGLIPPASVRVGLVGLGGFGERVTLLLAADEPESRIFGAEDMQTAIASSRILILACWRPAPALCDLADHLAFRYERAWLPVILEESVIRVGPLIHPTSGPCFRCFRRRALQHDDNRAVTIVVHQAYDRDPDCGPDGYLPCHARAAAGVAHSVVAGHPSAQPSQASAVVTISLLRAGAVQRNAVLPWPDCPRCSRREPSPSDTVRSVIRDTMPASCPPDLVPMSGGVS
jgi:bacteriocin biosynthesis cyclodehydratase domain-containing protein